MARTIILHVARKLRKTAKEASCNIHPHKWLKMLDRCWPKCAQRWVHCDPPPPRDCKPHVVILHALNLRPHLVERYRKAYPKAILTGLSYNHLWWSKNPTQKSAEFKAFAGCDVVFGRMPPGVEVPDAINWRTMGQLVDEKVFKYVPDKPRPIDVLVPRGWNKSDVYWPEETKEALRQFADKHIVNVDGTFTEEEMAQLFQQAKCTVSLREDAGVGYSTVEAALCGSILLVSDCPGPRSEFSDGGAIIVPRNLEAITDGLHRSLEMDEEERAVWVERNTRHFQKYTLSVQGPPIVAAIQELR